jgi:uncharacterized protein
MIAGPTIRGDKLFVLQSAMTAKTYGAPNDYIAKRKLFDQALYDAVISAPSDAMALDRAKAIVAKGLADKIIDSNEASTLPQDDARPWERYFLAYDPAPTLAKLTIPVLALNGSLDVQVPAKEDLAIARVALKTNPNATIIELAGMNHLLQDAKTGCTTTLKRRLRPLPSRSFAIGKGSRQPRGSRLTDEPTLHLIEGNRQ